MNILDMLDELESVIANAKKPLLQGDKVVVEQETVYRYLDQIRAALPDEIRDAQWVKKEEQRILETAKADYERILQEAQVEADRYAEQTEIVRRARQKAEEIIIDAQQTARDLTEGAFMYANDIMEKIEKQLTIYYDVVQDGREEIQKSLHQLQQQSQAEEEEA